MIKEVIQIIYHNKSVGAVLFNTKKNIAYFEYDQSFLSSGIELSPLHMPLSSDIYHFSKLNFSSFKGLPGLLADSLPGQFTNQLLNTWMISKGNTLNDITPLQRLQLIGKRGMGAIEYLPSKQIKFFNSSKTISIPFLIEQCQKFLNSKNTIIDLQQTQIQQDDLLTFLSVSTSVKGSKPKATVAFNKNFTKIRSGQTNIPNGFTHYLIKFDNINPYNCSNLTFSSGWRIVEYVYYKMALACGIKMKPSKLLHEGNRYHFITERFDRIGNKKIHVQTLYGLAHINDQSTEFSYEQLFDIAQKLKLSNPDIEQLAIRMFFNIIARNHNDHSKNFAFMLNEIKWSLAPAYNLIYSYNPNNAWAKEHRMNLNGKKDLFVRQDFYFLEKKTPLFNRKKINYIIDQIIYQVSKWQTLAFKAGISNNLIKKIHENLRLNI